MEYAYATLLLNESNQEINEKNLTAVLEASGNTVETSRIKALVAALEEVNLDNIADDIDGGDPTVLADAHSNGDATTQKETDVDTLLDESGDEFEFESSNEATTGS